MNATRRPAVKFWIAAGLVMSSALEVSPAAEAPVEAVEKFIQQLGDADAATREHAQKSLVDLGPPAIPALLQAVRSPDPEVIVRARAALEQIMPPLLAPIWDETVTAPTYGNVATVVAGDRTLLLHARSFLLVAREVTGGRALTSLPRSAWSARARAPGNAPAGNIVWIEVAGDTVLTGQSDGQVVAYEAASGKPRWAFSDATAASLPAPAPRPGPASANSNDPSAPCIVDGKVYFANNAAMYGVDLASGVANWKSPLPGPIFGHPVAWGTAVLLPGPKALYSFNLQTGDAQALPLGVDLYSVPAVVGDTAYIAVKNGLAAFDLNTHQQVWVHEASTQEGPGRRPPAVIQRPPGSILKGLPAPVVHKETVVYSTMEALYALHLPDGKMMWTWRPRRPAEPAPVVRQGGRGPTAPDRFPAFSVPVFADDSQMVISTTSGLFGLDARAGWPVWAFRPADKLDSMRLAPPVISDHMVHAFFSLGASGGPNTHMYALPQPAEK